MSVVTRRQDLDRGIQKLANFGRLHKHATLPILVTVPQWAELAYQATPSKHDGYGNMFQIHRTPFTSGIRQVLEEDVRNTIYEDDEGFRKFCGGNSGFPPHLAAGWFDVPCPSILGETAYPSA